MLRAESAAVSPGDQVAAMASFGSAAQRLDRLPLMPFHWRMMGLIGGGLFFDAFDIYIGGTVTGTLLKEGLSTLELNAAFTSATFIGLMLGAWLAGVLGDAYGRRFSYQFNLALFGLTSLAAALSSNMYYLISCRFVMGIGLGAEIVVCYSTLSEFVPPGTRGRLVGILALIGNSTVFVASIVSLWVIPNLGWQYLFVIAGAGALILWYLRKAMPESPRWLESKGRYEEADRVLKKIEAEAPGGLPPVGALSRQPPKDKVPISILVSPAVLPRFVLGCLIQIGIGISTYGLVTWLPSFFVKQGFSIVQSLTWSSVMSLGGPMGGIVGLLLADRLGRRPLLTFSAAMAAVFGVLYQFAGTDTQLLTLGFLLVSAIYTMIVVGQGIYLPELFDTSYRLRAVGLCSVAGRGTAAGIQFVVVWLFAIGGLGAVIWTVSGFLAMLALVVWFMNIETRRLSLERVAPKLSAQ
jgi:MFS transporter, putative metabolite:H+ symporter